MKNKFLLFAGLLISFISTAQVDVINDSVKIKEISTPSTEKKVKKLKYYNKFFLSANYGLGFRTASVEKDIPQLERDFQKELKSGNSYQLKIGYKYNRNSYYGLTYSQFSSSTSLNDIIFTEPTGLEGVGSTNQTNTINYYGVAAGWTMDVFSRKDTFCFDLSLGYINYSEKRQFYNTYEAKGGTLGISTDISYYFRIIKNLKIGPTFSFNGGAIKKYEIKGSNGYATTVKFDENTFLSLYRIDLMIGTYFEF